MKLRIFTRGATVALGFASMRAFSQTPAPAGTPQSLGWFLGGSAPDPGGRAIVGPGGVVIDPTGGPGARRGAYGGFIACTDDIAKYCAGQNGFGARGCLMQNSDKLSTGCKTELATHA